MANLTSTSGAGGRVRTRLPPQKDLQRYKRPLHPFVSIRYIEHPIETSASLWSLCLHDGCLTRSGLGASVV